MKVKLKEQELEQVSEFVYLGSLITEDGKCTADVKRRIGLHGCHALLPTKQKSSYMNCLLYRY